MFSKACFRQFKRKIALKVFGVCSKGRAASEKVEDVLPPAASTSLAIKSWQNPLPLFRGWAGSRRFASFGDEG